MTTKKTTSPQEIKELDSKLCRLSDLVLTLESFKGEGILKMVEVPVVDETLQITSVRQDIVDNVEKLELHIFFAEAFGFKRTKSGLPTTLVLDNDEIQIKVENDFIQVTGETIWHTIKEEALQLAKLKKTINYGQLV